MTRSVRVPASTGWTALGTNEDGSWVVVNYNGTYGWLKTEFFERLISKKPIFGQT